MITCWLTIHQSDPGRVFTKQSAYPMAAPDVAAPLRNKQRSDARPLVASRRHFGREEEDQGKCAWCRSPPATP